MKPPDSPFIRYAPAALLLLCAIAVSLAISRDDGSRRHESISAGPRKDQPAGLEYKSIRRRAAASAKVPEIRKPIFVTSADKLPITPQEAAELLREYRHYDNPESRGKSCATVIRRLCHSGFTAEAFAAIETAPSACRDAGIEAFFLAVSLPDEAISAKAMAFLEKNDIATALASFYQRLPFTELGDLLGREEPLSEEKHKAVTQWFDLKMDSATDRAQAISQAGNFYRRGWIGPEVLVRAVRESPDSDIFAKWDRLDELAIPAKDRDLVVNEMLKEDAPRAMKQFMDLEVAGKKAPFLYSMVIWTRMDFPGALKWSSANESSLTSSQRDDAIIAFAIHSQENLDETEAGKWAAKVLNPEKKAMLLGTLPKIRDRYVVK